MRSAQPARGSPKRKPPDAVDDQGASAPRDAWDFLREATTARIALGRVGDGLPTRRVLEFQLAHAQARDAVHAALDVAALCADLADVSPIVVQSQAGDRGHYLQRPDLGRSLSAAARARVCSLAPPM